MRAERRAGELLREMEKNKGAKPGKTGRKARPALDTRPKLADIGVTKTQSSRWQKLADKAPAAAMVATRDYWSTARPTAFTARGKCSGEAGPGRGKAGSKTRPAFNAPPKLSDIGGAIFVCGAGT
jgi:hypothetical protein